jgi:uroporphyrinogen-III synthase
MAVELAKEYAPETPYAIVYDAGMPTQTIVRGTAGELALQPPLSIERPGLLLFGEFTQHEFPLNGALAGRKIWITGSDSITQKARLAITDHGGIPVVQPLIHFEATDRVKIRPSKGYNLLVVTSPTAAKMLMAQMTSPIQFLPKKIAVTGPATAEALTHLNTDILMPERHYTAKGLLAALPEDLRDMKILRIRSEEAGPSLAEALKQRGAKVKDHAIYRTVGCPTQEPPMHDAVFLASSSAAKAWLDSSTDRTKEVIAMGEPTASVLRAAGVEPCVVAPVQTVEEALFAYAVRCTHV